ncbi:MAG: hypothetical protein JSW61_00720 [Candidatus Thorarchaeota archaeon]|nr:MAG: hypothetical protein JSW61_00720 [Candidatus Thorarchaeota archaeon]
MQNSWMFLGIESLIVAVLLLGWYFGARRLNFNIHHLVVYTVILAHALVVFFWMIPTAQEISNWVFSNPIGNLRLVLHFGIGMVADILSIALAVLFIFRRDMPLSILRRARPVMITTLTLWVIAYGLGVVNLLLRYL